MAHKYNAKKTEVDGITFDSKKEAKRYQELKLLEKAGKITDLELQPSFTLLPKFIGSKSGIKHRAITYKADFSYCENGVYVIEDVKGFETKDFKIKRKLFEHKFPDILFKIV